MQPIDFDTFTFALLRDAAVGLPLVAITLAFTATFFSKIFLRFNKSCAANKHWGSTELVFRFVIAISLLCVVQICAILIWTAAIYSIGLSKDLSSSMLFAGSCYTTLGIFTDDLPPTWKSIAFYIAFSGLFSFALATTAMISMTNTISKNLEHK